MKYLLFVLILLAACSGSDATRPASPRAPAQEPPGQEDLLNIMSPVEADPRAPRGVRVRKPAAFEGYTLIAPINGTTTYLIDLDGEIVHSWQMDSAPGEWCYLLDDGNLLRAGREDRDPHFRGGGIGGRVQLVAPDGSLLWNYSLANDERHQHHDLEPLPNGNVLLITWERKSAEEALARGRDPRAVGTAGLWPDAILEVRPTPPEGGEVVWEWHAWDHLVQDVEPGKPDYGVVAEHPGRIDINAGFEAEDQLSDEQRAAAEMRAAQMAALGYAGGEEEPEQEPDGPPPGDWDSSGDWLHTNAIDYCAEYDLLILSSPELSELMVIDHSTTSAEAASSSGGRWGHGGDLLWRWGNPAMHDAGGDAQRRLFYQHDPTWIVADDLRVLVFNNGGGRPDGDYSSVEELVLPFDPRRGFVLEAGRACGPPAPIWSYSDPETFYSAFISGAQRLPGGNTFICSGASGHLFEVTAEGEVVWDYGNELGGEVEPPEHAGHAPPLALFRGTRLALDHPGVLALLRY